ncbi:MAG: hypothetical protein A3J55_00420 [Candidatus Ryanbacteria bacterium RIFCSPHIGHO2_02_FULL_45_17b]|uniref:Sialate O-acetylesterase domain-containing protein n=1 Tax=Candidatus Ryanbacteria bacterium RIFCSPHIGHO2_01_FULL_45_22 TaxID=1802114 RepID=A0A1G2G1K8_9BACT|nr:MAG: hypothetical protein A2719_02885 [Candidatus Ryanbacteria bacterium RIFCSPHIGHO2_01_FULL_45_22]OGZ47007.1 MAG: hypothetical protein A3J55_00420 [Candidatus Ryanbacteria bacterium RIFCSPHIGHO2_02_FULL_45_17b]
MESPEFNGESHVEQADKVIFACFENPDTLSPESKEKIDQIKKEGVNIDWHATQGELEKRDMKHGCDDGSYAISPVDSKDKYSEGYFICLGIVAVGRNREGENISFMSHQNPGATFVEEIEEKFSVNLAECLTTLKEQSIEGSIDIVFLGGQYPRFDSSITEEYYWDAYEESMNKMRDIVFSTINIEPTIITGPKTEEDATKENETNAYFSTHDRRLYVVQDDYTLGQAGRVSDIQKIYKR